MTDEVLIQQMSMTTSAEKERDKKLKTNNRSKPPTVSVSSVSDDLPKEKQESKKSNSQSDILAAIIAIKSEVEALKGEIRKQSSNRSVPHTKGPERKGPPMSSNCLQNKMDYCNHCFKCGSDSHFARGCRQQLNRSRLLLHETGTSRKPIKSLKTVTSAVNLEESKDYLGDAVNAKVYGIAPTSVKRNIGPNTKRYFKQ